jgi:hypothetical protein
VQYVHSWFQEACQENAEEVAAWLVSVDSRSAEWARVTPMKLKITLTEGSVEFAKWFLAVSRQDSRKEVCAHCLFERVKMNLHGSFRPLSSGHEVTENRSRFGSCRFRGVVVWGASLLYSS